MTDQPSTTAPPTAAHSRGTGTVRAVVESIRRVHGRDLSCYDETFLILSLERRIVATDHDGPQSYLAHLATDRAEAEAFLSSLDIHHSELFRDPLLYARLEQQVLPSLAAELEISASPELRVWSAGCAGGQEAYSLAILLTELSDGRARPVPFRLFATDSDAAQLARARRGVYGPAEMRNVRLRHLERWFVRQGDDYVVSPELRQRVDFSVHDLLDERAAAPAASIFGGFDLVMCCNVLYYYGKEARVKIMDSVRRSLRDGGRLETGEAAHP